ncbi:MAG: class I tRNA ligase family protein, partial [bacterium]
MYSSEMSSPVRDKPSVLWNTEPGKGPVEVFPHIHFPELDHLVLDLWDKKRIFQRTIEERDGAPDYVAYDGPPGTNGAPHIGHILQSALKDLWPRFWTMRGYRVLRKAGWDTHGLPVELTAEKELGLKSKRHIHSYGVERYIEYCRSTVYRYKEAWTEAIRRIGRFLDTENYYATLTKDYIQTGWWVLKQFWNKGLLYKDYRILPYCSRCGTTLSQHETAQGYRDIEDISLYVKFRHRNEPKTYFVAWTTTPWTLLSNVALAVHPELYYLILEKIDGERLIIAEPARDVVEPMVGNVTVINRLKGKEFEGWEYEPLWPFLDQGGNAHRVVCDDYVTATEGTGVVHLALYGEDDFRLIRKWGFPLIQNVDAEGYCLPSTGPFAGRWFREPGLDQSIADDLRHRQLLLGEQKVVHSYPHCYRCDTPLMYFAKTGWFLKTTAYKEEMIRANEEINWFPPHIKYGRFGNWLEGNVDWNISRERYWGTPLPIWRCPKCQYEVCVGSLKELEELYGKPLSPQFDPHKPHIDQIFLPCPECDGQMVREPEVLDSWFDAGIMPWGQWGYPSSPGSEEVFQKQY